jgi:hypothetical protein
LAAWQSRPFVLRQTACSAGIGSHHVSSVPSETSETFHRLGLPSRWIPKSLSNVIHGRRSPRSSISPFGKVADRRPLKYADDGLCYLDPRITRGTNVFPRTRLGTVDAVDRRDRTIEGFADFPERDCLGRPGQRVTAVEAAHGLEQAVSP